MMKTLVPAAALVRRVRRRRRLALPGAAGDPQLLVSDLAGPAGRAGAGQPADRRAAGRASGCTPVLAAARQHELCVIHTSTPSFAADVKVAAALKDANPALKIGFVGAKVAVQPEESLTQGAPIDFVARNEFDFTIKEIAEGRDWADIDGISYRDANGRDHAQPGPRDPGGHGPAALRHRGLQARPADRGLFHRLPAAPLRVALHRPRLQIALHLLPVAADRRRPSLPRALAGPCRRGDRAGQAVFPAGAGILLRRRHLHRQPAARRGDRAASWASSASPGRATPRPTCRATR